MDDIVRAVTEAVPVDLFAGVPEVTVDREEIYIVGRLRSSDQEASTGEDRVDTFRERTRSERIKVAAQLEDLFNRKVAWGVTTDEETVMFTHLATPVMTRLRQPERRVLDTLVEGGVARSRSDALAWCVRLVGQNETEWIQRLQDALKGVQEARRSGPT